MKILHVMKVCPFPPRGGFESDIWNRFVALCELGCSVDVIMTTRTTSPDPEAVAKIKRLANRVYIVRRSLGPASIFTSAPCLASTNKVLAAVPLHDDYDAVLAESENMAWVFGNPRLRAKRRFLRVHNDEARYYRTLANAEERPHWKAFFAMEALRFRRYSERVFRQCDGIWCISRDERDRIARNYPELSGKCYWLPPAIPKVAAVERAPSRSRTVLCVGSLNVSLNREAIRWYLKEVHPSLLGLSDYRVAIAGGTRGSNDARSFAEQLRGTERCEVHVDVPDLQPLYDRCAMVINPMQRGAGVKMKTIHAVQYKLPLVTTSTGAEGSAFRHGEHILVADDARGFGSHIQCILEDPGSGQAMAERAYMFLAEHYDQQAKIGRLLHGGDADPIQLESLERDAAGVVSPAPF
jgi:glycosyltransferase involved in cell wall biosynthesis